MLSMIVPTYNESENIEKIVKQIFASCKKIGVEIIIVDDNSPDGTGDIAENLKKKYAAVTVIHRSGKLGLGSAVVAGFSNARGSILGVIDADLSHPPELIPKLFDPIKNGQADFVIASRLVAGGQAEEWPLLRKLISAGARILARPLTSVKDTMAGYFLLKKEVLEGVRLAPCGYKIGLEILVKGHYRKVAEIPYTFRNREMGTSKLDMKEEINYLRLLLSLYWYRIRHIRR